MKWYFKLGAISCLILIASFGLHRLVRAKPSTASGSALQAPDDGDYGWRTYDYQIKNDNGTVDFMPCVSGSGSLPIRLDITSAGSACLADSRLQVFVAIYACPDPTMIELGPLVKTYLDPRVMTTPANASQTFSFSSDIALDPGNYYFYVFLCDPDEFYIPEEQVAYFPDMALFPGLVRKLTLFTARIQAAGP